MKSERKSIFTIDAMYCSTLRTIQVSIVAKEKVSFDLFCDSTFEFNQLVAQFV